MVLVLIAIALLFSSTAYAQRLGNGGPRRGHRPPPLLFSRGLATDASASTTDAEVPYTLVVVPKPPARDEESDEEVSEDSEQERPDLEDLELIGHFAYKGRHLLLSNVAITTEEITPEDSDEAIKVISSLSATLNLPPSREDMEEAKENGEEITLEEVGTIEITIAGTEFEDENGESRMRPEVSGTASFTTDEDEDVSLTLNGGLGLPPRPQGRQGGRRGESQLIEDDEAESVTDGF